MTLRPSTPRSTPAIDGLFESLEAIVKTVLCDGRVQPKVAMLESST